MDGETELQSVACMIRQERPGRFIRVEDGIETGCGRKQRRARMVEGFAP
jgi:hypothetical protein